MGMFDYVRCDYPLLDPAHNARTFQTKDLPSLFLDEYIITREGRLVHEDYATEPVPEEERPFYGRPIWEMAFARLAGAIRRVPTGRTDMGWDGDVAFYDYDTTTGQSVEYVARFGGGQLTSVRRVGPPATGGG